MVLGVFSIFTAVLRACALPYDVVLTRGTDQRTASTRFPPTHTSLWFDPNLLCPAHVWRHRSYTALYMLNKNPLLSLSALFLLLPCFPPALLPKLVSALHLPLRTHPPTEKRARRHRILANLYGGGACFFRNQLPAVLPRASTDGSEKTLSEGRVLSFSHT